MHSCKKKTVTMRMKGGNTDELYAGVGRRLMTESLIRQHPDVVRPTHRFGHIHHMVDYRPFKKNKLILRDDLVIPKQPNNYGMELKPAV